MNSSQLEQRVIETLRPGLEERGYKILPSYSRTILPRNLKGYLPDFIAQKGNDFIAFEVKSRKIRPIHDKLLELKKDIESDENWQFEIIYEEDIVGLDGAIKVSKSTIEESLGEVSKLAKSEQMRAAFLLSWAILEASVRYLHPRVFAKPQTPGRIVTVLSERGDFSPERADELRRLSQKRNSLIHGSLDTVITMEDVKTMVAAIDELLKQAA